MDSSPNRTCKLATIIIALSVVAPTLVMGQTRTRDTNQLTFEAKHRVNAHGDEFNALANSADKKRLFVGTEKGDIIVWNVALQKVERTLHQPSGVHHVTALSDPNYLIASGANHHEPRHPLVRKWNVETGAFVDLAVLDQTSFPMALATDSTLIAVGGADGKVVVWDEASEKIVATWKLKEVPMSLAIVGRSLFIASINRAAITSDDANYENVISKLSIDDPQKDPTEFLRVPGRFWAAVAAYPDGRLLSASYRSPREGERTVIIESDSSLELGSFSASASAWINSTNLLLFSGLDPTEHVQVTNGKAVTVKKLEQMESDTHGRAFDLSGQVTSADGGKVWASYRKGPGLLEFDLASRKIKTLIGEPSGAYALSVINELNDGLLLTGGGDGYVRLWKLSDLSLRREYKIATPQHFVTTVHLVPGGRQAVVGIMRIRKELEQPSAAEPTEIMLLDLETGVHRKLLDVRWAPARTALIGNQLMYPDVNRIKLVTLESGQPIREFKSKAPILKSAVSSSGQWLAMLDYGKTLSVFEIQTGKQILAKPTTADEWGPIVITNDGRCVYQVASQGKLTRWDTKSGAVSESVLTRLRDMHTRADFITLANDDKWLVTAGNHGDVGIFDRITGKLVSYTQTPAAGFYVEKVWVSGDQMIFTTDTGVMFKGRLIK